MRVSKKTDYALRALFTLVDHYGGAPIPIRELARRNDVPKRFLEQIMLALKSQGWVSSDGGNSRRLFAAQEIRPKSPWAKWCVILTAFWRQLIAFPSPATNVVRRNRSAVSAAFSLMPAIMSPNLMDRATWPRWPRGLPVSQRRHEISAVLLAAKAFKNISLCQLTKNYCR